MRFPRDSDTSRPAGVHPIAAAGFAAGADEYDRGRPSYAPAAIEWLAARTGIGANAKIVDLAAGTGKLTEALVATAARVIAVEPVAEMRAKLVQRLPAVEALDGAAEAIPLGDGSADLVAVGQAFHWFRAEEALAEIARVLVPGGWLALLWNTRDLAYPLQKAIDDLLRPHREATPVARARAWREDLEASQLFGLLEGHEVANVHLVTRDGLRDRVASTSFVAAMDERQREQLLQRVLALVEGEPEPFPFPYVTEVFVAKRA